MVLLAVIAGAVYYFRLTADVEVSDASPVAPTLAVPTAAASPTTAAVEPTAASADPAAATTAPAATAPVAGARVYRIDAAQSTATYTVSETFFRENNRVANAVGTTNAIAGDILIDTANPAGSQVGDIVVDISQLKSDSNRRDNAIRREWLESATYPLATFANARIVDLPSDLQAGQPFSFKLEGDMTIHDTTNPVVWDVTLVLDGDTLRGSASTTLAMSDYNVSPPDIAGILKAEDTALLGLQFIATAVE